MVRLFRVLLALVMLVATMSLAVAPMGTAALNPNTPVTEYVDVTFEAPNLTAMCDFDVWANVAGIFTYQSRPGGIEFLRFRYTHTFSGPGGSVSVHRVENARYALTA